MRMIIGIALYVSGAFTLALGAVHFFFPRLFDFRGGIPLEGPPLKPLRLGFIRYATQRSDVRGIAWMMNLMVSFVLVTLGGLDLLWRAWLDSPFGRPLALWMAGWWFLRAGGQLYLGRRRGDWLILAGFAALGVLHLVLGLL